MERFRRHACGKDQQEAAAAAELRALDDEGELTTEDVKADFVKGRPRGVTAVLILKSATEWSRFMRFMRLSCVRGPSRPESGESESDSVFL